MQDDAPNTQESSLEGQLLIAMPNMTDGRFARSVIYMCAHSDEGAMGLIINQRAKEISFPDLIDQIDMGDDAPAAEEVDRLQDRAVHAGGPVETSRGFVLHSIDYFVEAASLKVDEDVALTATVDVLKAIAADEGPEKSILALGYSGWGPGQLEGELRANGWLHGPADPEILFDIDIDAKYDAALGRLGISLSHLASSAGHA